MEVLPHDKISPGITKLFSLTEYDLKFFKNKTKNHNKKTQHTPLTEVAVWIVVI